MNKAKQVFGLTKSTAYVEGEAIHFSMTETGTFATLPSDKLDYTAWDALTDEEKTALYQDARAASGWQYGKQGVQS